MLLFSFVCLCLFSIFLFSRFFGLLLIISDTFCGLLLLGRRNSLRWAPNVGSCASEPDDSTICDLHVQLLYSKWLRTRIQLSIRCIHATVAFVWCCARTLHPPFSLFCFWLLLLRLLSNSLARLIFSLSSSFFLLFFEIFVCFRLMLSSSMMFEALNNLLVQCCVCGVLFDAVWHYA